MMTVLHLPYLEVIRVSELGPCWEWALSRNEARGGYGQMRLNGRTLKAHRIAYEKWVGEIPKGHGVLHHCDNPPCIRPAHLFTGTTADNSADMIAKGRGVNPVMCGEKSPHAKLTAKQVRTIRKRLTNGESLTVLGKEFQVTKQAIYRIRERLSWNTIQ